MKLGEPHSRRTKPTYVLNATPIIHFSKIGMLDLILEICDAFITEEVYREAVVRGEGFPDSAIIREAVEKGKLKVYHVRTEGMINKLLRHGEIHRGEAETIVAAKELDGTAIIDDAEARTVAKAYNVKVAPGCIFLIFRLLKLGRIKADEAEDMIEKLVKSGLYLDPETLLNAYRKIRAYAISEGRGKPNDPNG